MTESGGFMQRDGDFLFIKLAGQIKEKEAAAWREHFLALFESGVRRVVVDCSAMTFIGATGMGSLAALNRRLVASRGNMQITGLRAPFDQLFAQLRFTETSRTVANQQAARPATKSP